MRSCRSEQVYTTFAGFQADIWELPKVQCHLLSLLAPIATALDTTVICWASSSATEILRAMLQIGAGVHDVSRASGRHEGAADDAGQDNFTCCLMFHLLSALWILQLYASH